MADLVLDASALLALLRCEPGADQVEAVRPSACISAVNLAETFGKMVEHGKPLEATVAQITRLRLTVVPFDEVQAGLAASIWRPARVIGLSFGDRACLALALSRGLPVLTADRAWAKLDVGLPIRVIR